MMNKINLSAALILILFASSGYSSGLFNSEHYDFGSNSKSNSNSNNHDDYESDDGTESETNYYYTEPKERELEHIKSIIKEHTKEPEWKEELDNIQNDMDRFINFLPNINPGNHQFNFPYNPLNPFKPSPVFSKDR